MTDHSLPAERPEQFYASAMYDALKPFVAALQVDAPRPDEFEAALVHLVHGQVHEAVMAGFLLSRYRSERAAALIPVMSEDEAADVEPGWVCSWATGSNWDPENTDNCDYQAEWIDDKGRRWCTAHAPSDEFATFRPFSDPREIDETR